MHLYTGSRAQLGLLENHKTRYLCDRYNTAVKSVPSLLVDYMIQLVSRLPKGVSPDTGDLHKS